MQEAKIFTSRITSACGCRAAQRRMDFEPRYTKTVPLSQQVGEVDRAFLHNHN